MKCRVHKALKGADPATITLSLVVRKQIAKSHNAILDPPGHQVAPVGGPVRKIVGKGYAIRVEGSKYHSARNPIVHAMSISHRPDPLLNKKGVVRVGRALREKLGIKTGDHVNISPLDWQTWMHGTKANPPTIIRESGWIIGSGMAYGPGLYMSTELNMVRGYASTGLIVAEVAWGAQLSWPLPRGKLRNDFIKWCREHSVNPIPLLSMQALYSGGQFCDSYTTRNGRHDSYICRWARLNGHYLYGGTNIRIFPGPLGNNFKPNRCRVMKILNAAGHEIWRR